LLVSGKERSRGQIKLDEHTSINGLYRRRRSWIISPEDGALPCGGARASRCQSRETRCRSTMYGGEDRISYRAAPEIGAFRRWWRSWCVWSVPAARAVEYGRMHAVVLVDA
jgi:hypothetical protein